jgi:hypothetical protein
MRHSRPLKYKTLSIISGINSAIKQIANLLTGARYRIQGNQLPTGTEKMLIAAIAIPILMVCFYAIAEALEEILHGPKQK